MCVLLKPSPLPQYLKKLHTQERAVEEVKLAIKPYYQRKDINKDEYKDILRKAVHKVGSRPSRLQDTMHLCYYSMSCSSVEPPILYWEHFAVP